MMIQLTQYETGKAVLIDSRTITSVRELGAFVSDISDVPQEEGDRTRVDYGNQQLVLVTESAAEITKLIGWIVKSVPRRR